MSYVSYGEIEHLIDNLEVNNGRVEVYFKCSETGRVVKSTGALKAGVTSRVAGRAQDGLIRMLLNSLSRMIRSSTGVSAPLGSAVGGGTKQVVTKEMEHEATVDAFKQVSVYPGENPDKKDCFQKVNGKWVYAI